MAAAVLMTLVVSSVSMAKPSSLDPQVGSIDVRKIDPNVFKKPILLPVPNSTSSISGKIKFLKGQYGSVPKCQDAKVYLVSDEYTEKPAPKPKPGEISLGSTQQIPVFIYEGKVSPDSANGNSDSKTAYCKYSVSAEKQFVGKKAQVVFSPSNSICGKSSDPNTTVIVPAKPVKKNYQVTVCGIG